MPSASNTGSNLLPASPVKNLLINFILLIIYFAVGKFSLEFAYLNQSASSFWVPTGIAIVSLITFGLNVWPAIFLGAFFVNYTTTWTIFSSLGIALGNTLEGVIAFLLIKKFFDIKNFFDSPVKIQKYLSIVLVSTFICALIGTASLSLDGLSKDNFDVFITWWVGDLGGALVFASVFFLWLKDYRINWTPKQIFEAAAVLILLISTTIIIFNFPSIIKLPLIIERYPFPLLTFPLILYVSFRFGTRETATFILIFFLVASIGIINGSDRMAIDDEHLSLRNLQIFTIIVFILKMSVSAAVTQRSNLEKSLRNKISQVSAVSELGLAPLSGKSSKEVMQLSLRLLHNRLDINFSKILKLLPGGKELLLLEGLGWENGLVGVAKVSTDIDSQAGYTLLSKEPVIVEDLNKETRFNGPALLNNHNVVSGMSCIIYGKDKPFGVIGVHTKTKTFFSKNDVDFLQSVANIIALTIERTTYEEEIFSSLEEKEILIKEIHHRVKNNLQIVSSLLNLQSTRLSPDNYKELYIKSRNQVKSIAVVHEMLYRSKNLSQVDFNSYVNELSKFILDSYNVENIQIIIDSHKINLEPDMAINLGLIINETISNSIKYAFDGSAGKIYISLITQNNGFYHLTIKDNGKGLPVKFDINNISTLGMQLIKNLVSQINGNMEIQNGSGTSYSIQFAV